MEIEAVRTAAANKQRMQAVFAALAEGNRAPFGDVMADDIVWTVTGANKWSRTYRGKQVVIEELLRPVFARFRDRYTGTAHRFIAEGDHVVIEWRGNATTKEGKPYNNSYCTICRLADGKVCELTEYMDSALAIAVL